MCEAKAVYTGGGLIHFNKRLQSLEKMHKWFSVPWHEGDVCPNSMVLQLESTSVYFFKIAGLMK